MDSMKYFIKRFVQENRQGRWIYLMEKSWEKFFDNMGQMERHLNGRCRLVCDNSIAHAQSVIDRKGIKTGVYYGDREQGKEISLASLEGFLLDCTDGIWGSFIVCRPEKTAFYLHHEGWVWICEEQAF